MTVFPPRFFCEGCDIRTIGHIDPAGPHLATGPPDFFGDVFQAVRSTGTEYDGCARFRELVRNADAYAARCAGNKNNLVHSFFLSLFNVASKIGLGHCLDKLSFHELKGKSG